MRNTNTTNAPQRKLSKAALKHIGEVKTNKNGTQMEIIDYINCDHVVVKFETGNTKVISYDHFKSGSVKNPYDRTVFNFGYIGEGKYKSTDTAYTNWAHMIERCYDPKFLNANPTYRNTVVCDEWLNFQNFAAWYHENYYTIEGCRMSLDKDILVKGNKVYSPQTCVIVPDFINSTFGNIRTTLTGEALEKHKLKRIARISEITEQYKDQIPAALYNALLTYQL